MSDAPIEQGSLGATERVLALWGDLRGIAGDHLELVALETQRAAESFVWMVVAGILVAGLVAISWLGLIAVGVLWMVDLGLYVGFAILIAVIPNAFVAYFLYLLICNKGGNLRYPATLRSLRRHS